MRRLDGARRLPSGLEELDGEEGVLEGGAWGIGRRRRRDPAFSSPRPGDSFRWPTRRPPARPASPGGRGGREGFSERARAGRGISGRAGSSLFRASLAGFCAPVAGSRGAGTWDPLGRECRGRAARFSVRRVGSEQVGPEVLVSVVNHTVRARELASGREPPPQFAPGARPAPRLSARLRPIEPRVRPRRASLSEVSAGLGPRIPARAEGQVRA